MNSHSTSDSLASSLPKTDNFAFPIRYFGSLASFSRYFVVSPPKKWREEEHEIMRKPRLYLVSEERFGGSPTTPRKRLSCTLSPFPHEQFQVLGSTVENKKKKRKMGGFFRFPHPLKNTLPVHSMQLGDGDPWTP